MIRKFFQDSLTYTIPTVLTRGIGVILLPFYARNLAPAEYGTIEILTLIYVLLNLVLPLEISQAVARFSADAKNSSERSVHVSAAFCFTGLVFLAFVIVAWVTPVSGGRMPLRTDAAVELLPLASVWMMANALLYIVLNQLRWNQQSRAYSWISIVFTLGAAVVSVVLIAIFKYGVYGYIWGQLFGSLVALIFGLASLQDTSRVRLSLGTTELKRMLAFSVPLVLSSLAVYLTLYVDRWILLAWRGVDELGLYAVGYRIASIVALAVTGVQLALTPLIYSHYTDPATPGILRRIFRLFLAGTLSIVALAGAFTAEIIGFLAGPQYSQSGPAVPWLCIGMALMNAYIFAPGLILAKRTKIIALLSATSAAVNVTANIVLIPIMGIVGAALGMVIGAAVLAALYFWWSERYYQISYEWRRYALAVLALMAFLLALELQEPGPVWRATMWGAACTAFGWLLIDRAELKWLYSQIGNLKPR